MSLGLFRLPPGTRLGRLSQKLFQVVSQKQSIAICRIPANGNLAILSPGSERVLRNSEDLSGGCRLHVFRQFSTPIPIESRPTSPVGQSLPKSEIDSQLTVAALCQCLDARIMEEVSRVRSDAIAGVVSTYGDSSLPLGGVSMLDFGALTACLIFGAWHWPLFS